MKSTKKLVKRALPVLWVDENEYLTLEELAAEHDMTITQLLTELITPNGDKAGKWLVVQIDHVAYKAFEAYYDDDEEHHAEDMIEACVNLEGAKLAKELKAGAAR